MIKFKNISKRYAHREIIKKISFEINKGELVVLIGESGSGKTTLLKMINRLINPSSGKIYVDGEDIHIKNIIELRRNMGYVIQQTGLFPHMTIQENIEVIPTIQKKERAEIIKRSLELLEMVGLDPKQYLGRYPHELSGGQQQRVGVARAFACNPEIILMDEPFSALDPITRLQLQDELVELQNKMKKTIVFVTHDMDEAVKIADKICILDQGEIVQYDKVEEIMKNPVNEFVSQFMGKNRIWSSPEFIKTKDIMIKDPICTSPETTVMRCLEKMRTQKIDSLLIVDKKMHLQGFVGVKDVRLMAQSDKNCYVSEIMKIEFIKALPDENIVNILEIFNENNLSAIPIVDEDNIVQGLITKSSLLTTLSQQYLNTPEVM